MSKSRGLLQTILIITLSFCSGAQAADGWRAGAAKVDITPPAPMWMAGFASRVHPAEGKLTDLWAKALVLEDAAGQRGVLVTLDLVGIDRATSQSICSKLIERHGLRRDQIVLNVSHTHSGPVVAHNLGPLHYRLVADEQKKLIDEYAKLLEQRVLDVVDDAIKQLAPAELSWGSGIATFATNRRNNPQNQAAKLRELGKLRGPVDHDVPVLAVRTPEGNVRAVAFGYACHATVLSEYQWSGDYPGYAQLELEKLHPDAIALFWAGCGGDQNPLPRGTVELAKQYGQTLATSVEAVLGAPMSPIASRLATSYHKIDLPLDKLPTKDELLRDVKSDNKYTVSRATMLLEDLDAGRALTQRYPYPIAMWTLGGDVQWAFLGGEVVVDYALRLKNEFSGRKTWIAGYSNDVPAYIPSRRVLAEGRYEGGDAMVYYGLPTRWAPEVEELIVAEVHRQAQPTAPATTQRN
jgi:hypothetical protein